jgi:hypothetical protein
MPTCSSSNSFFAEIIYAAPTGTVKHRRHHQAVGIGNSFCAKNNLCDTVKRRRRHQAVSVSNSRKKNNLCGATDVIIHCSNSFFAEIIHARPSAQTPSSSQSTTVGISNSFDSSCTEKNSCKTVDADKIPQIYSVNQITEIIYARSAAQR